MRSYILAGAAALAFSATPALADGHGHGEGHVMTEAQQYDFKSWSTDQRAAYLGWPGEVQEYYWTLEPKQAAGWWILTDPQRLRVYEMTPEQRAKAWEQVNTQLSSFEEQVEEIAPEAPVAAPAPRFVRSEVSQTTPTTAATEGAQLPICSDTVTDGCINAWDAGERGAGVKRPLDYWPGRPASEIEEPLPATQEEFEGMQKAKAEAEAEAAAKAAEDAVAAEGDS